MTIKPKPKVFRVAGLGNGDKYCMHNETSLQSSSSYGGWWPLPDYLTFYQIASAEECWGSCCLNLLENKTK